MDPFVGFRIGALVYNSLKLNEKIDEVFENIKSVYTETGSAHFESAKQAYIAAEKGSYEVELNSAINHLRDAYNVYSKGINGQRKAGPFYKRYLKPLFSIEEKAEYYKQVSTIAALISITYRKLNEIVNSIDWKTKAIDDYYRSLLFEPYENFISNEELILINPDFIEEYESKEVDGYIDEEITILPYYKTVTKERLTPLGQEYVDEVIKKNLAIEYGDLIDQREINFKELSA